MKHSHILFVTLMIACVCAGLFQISAWANAYYLGRAQDAGRATLLLVAEAVDQAVGRFVPIPVLISGDPVLRQTLQEDAAQGFAPFMNEKLRQIAISVDASDVYVMDTAGMTIAASNYRDEDSFLGRDFSYRPYFQQSLAGKVAVFHALGTASGERGFYYSAPILDGIEVVGVLAVKMTVDEIEEDWKTNDHEILIADSNGIVFMANRDDFKFRALAPLNAATRRHIAETQQYPLAQTIPMDLSTNVIRPSTVQVMLSDQEGSDRFLAVSTPLEIAGWHAIVFTPLEPVQRQVFRTTALAAITLTAAILGALLVRQRRISVLEHIRIEQDQRVLLENRVRERTADLDAANASLRNEVTERRHAEEQLRKSQKELVQAGKLAALGKMSAAISHEINQPLAAIKSYAANASEFLVRSRVDDAKFNIENISKMSDRMAEISRHLRNFARQPGDTLRRIDVSEVIEETMALVGPQLRAQSADIRFTPPSDLVWALGGKLRLQQVLVNIIANALEAMHGQTNPVIEITLLADDQGVEIVLRDHGPGVAQENLDQVFDAFFTTKTSGAGMGLGMSISHNIISDFGGALSAGNHPDGGAIFRVSLKREGKITGECPVQ